MSLSGLQVPGREASLSNIPGDPNFRGPAMFVEPVEELGAHHKVLHGAVEGALTAGLRVEYQEEIRTLVFSRCLGAFRRAFTVESPANTPINDNTNIRAYINTILYNLLYQTASLLRLTT